MTTNKKMIIIGGSAGSLKVLLYLIPHLKPKFKIPIVIVLHRTASNNNLLEQILSAKTSLQVKEATEKDVPQSGTIYIAPPDYHLLFEEDLSFSLDYSEKIHFSRPSIDVTFQSAAEAYGSSLVCILLSGANADGAKGLKRVSQKGGTTVVQEPQSAETSYMPQQAIMLQQPNYTLTPEAITSLLNSL